jgi:hypothetical protein
MKRLLTLGIVLLPVFACVCILLTETAATPGSYAGDKSEPIAKNSIAISKTFMK